MNTTLNRMTQEAPWPAALVKLVHDLKYRDNWHFSLKHLDRGQGSVGLTLIIHIETVDTYHHENPIRINHYMLVPSASYNEASWRRWLLDQILLVERHEACEFFQIDGQRPYAPHHGFGEDPYIIWDRGTDQDARTSYRNEKRSTDDPEGSSTTQFSGQGSTGAMKQWE